MTITKVPFIKLLLSSDSRTWNMLFAGVYVLQAVVLLVLAKAYSVSVNVLFLNSDSLQSHVTGQSVVSLATHRLFDVNLVWVLLLMLVAAAIVHGLAATKLRKCYDDDMKRGVNTFRAVEGAVSTALMMIAVGLVVGLRDIAALVLVAGVTVAMYVLAFVLQSQKAHRYVTYIVASKLGGLAWLAMGIYLFAACTYGAAPSTFVWWMFGSLFVLFLAGVANMYLQYRKIGVWKNYLLGERLFLVIGLVAKTALVWQIFAGLLR